MTRPAQSAPTGLQSISRGSGGLAMVAIDQRDSLRVMFQAKQSEPVADSLLLDFKTAVAETLGVSASAMLFDRHFGLPAMSRLGMQHSACGKILAVDRLIQEPGQPVTDTEFEEAIMPDEARAKGVVALKFLLFWRGPASAAQCRKKATQFVEHCRHHGFVSVLEAMVRPPENVAEANWDREGALLEAATAMGAMRPDLYKGEVPYRGKAAPEAIARSCERISAAVDCPWVVLSQGVAGAEFPAAVRAACQGGASGFLAGRAIWSDIIGPGDYRDRLRKIALPRLQALVDVVDSAARPWDKARRAG
jgi:sulfofructosephosphate aldolase